MPYDKTRYQVPKLNEERSINGRYTGVGVGFTEVTNPEEIERKS